MKECDEHDPESTTETTALASCLYSLQPEHPENSRVFLHNGSSPGIDLFQVRCSCGARGRITGGKESAVAAWYGVILSAERIAIWMRDKREESL